MSSSNSGDGTDLADSALQDVAPLPDVVLVDGGLDSRDSLADLPDVSDLLSDTLEILDLGDSASEDGADAAPDGEDAPDLGDAQPDAMDLDAGPTLCTAPESCPAGQGCKEGLCGPCDDGADCRPLGLICGPQEICAPCASTEDCAAAAYESDVVCVILDPTGGEGVCVEDGCAGHEECPGALPVCDSESMTCRACDSHDECARALGEAAVCVDNGRCAPGDCYPAGVACGEDGDQDGKGDRACQDQGEAGYACQPCAADLACVGSLGIDHAVCLDGACAKGCLSKDDCEVGLVCDSGEFRCEACQQNADCTSDYGDSFLCVTGDCHGHADCAADGGICSERWCTPCVDLGDTGPDRDLACKLAFLDVYVCEDGACAAGCEAGSLCVTAAMACAQGQVCGEDNRFRDCAGDGDCVVAMGDEAAICAKGRCEEGCASNAACPKHGVCDDHRCRPCGNEPGATVDDCQANGFGASILCLEGQCVAAECNEVSPLRPRPRLRWDHAPVPGLREPRRVRRRLGVRPGRLWRAGPLHARDLHQGHRGLRL